MNLRIISLLCIPDVRVFQHFLRLSDAFEEDVALLVEPLHILHLLHLVLINLVAICDIVEFDEVLWEDEGVVEDEPQPLLLVILLRSEDAGHVIVHLGVDLGVAPDFGGRVARIEVRVVRILYTLRKEHLADEQLARRNLQEAALLCDFRRVLQVRVAILVLEVGVDARYLCAGNTIHQGNTVGQLRLGVLALGAESFFHRSVDLGGHGWVDAVEEVLQVPLVRIVREVNEMLKLFFESVSQEAVVDPCDPGHLDASDAVESHLLGVEAGADEVDAGGEPLVIRLAFLKPDIAASFQLRHQPVNVLL